MARPGAALRRTLLLALCCLAGAAAAATDPAAAAFARHGVQGTLLVVSDRRGELLVHDAERAERAYPVASTFKIPNTLIALETGVVAGPDALIPWDGVTRDLAVWNGDQTLTSAFRISCVWCYQRFARAIGADTYRDWLSRLDYGTLPDAFVVDSFWLDGSLRLSARGQIDFLGRLQRGELPIAPDTLAAAREIMRSDAGRDWTLWGKTGWFTRSTPGVGWYVGWVERGDETVLFAMNIDTAASGDLPARTAVVREVLSALGVLP